MRASNTTPVLALRFAGHTQQTLERIQGAILALLRQVKPDAALRGACIDGTGSLLG